MSFSSTSSAFLLPQSKILSRTSAHVAQLEEFGITKGPGFETQLEKAHLISDVFSHAEIRTQDLHKHPISACFKDKCLNQMLAEVHFV